MKLNATWYQILHGGDVDLGEEVGIPNSYVGGGLGYYNKTHPTNGSKEFNSE